MLAVKSICIKKVIIQREKDTFIKGKTQKQEYNFILNFNNSRKEIQLLESCRVEIEPNPLQGCRLLIDKFSCLIVLIGFEGVLF